MILYVSRDQSMNVTIIFEIPKLCSGQVISGNREQNIIIATIIVAFSCFNSNLSGSLIAKDGRGDSLHAFYRVGICLVFYEPFDGRRETWHQQPKWTITKKKYFCLVCYHADFTFLSVNNKRLMTYPRVSCLTSLTLHCQILGKSSLIWTSQCNGTRRPPMTKVYR